MARPVRVTLGAVSASLAIPLNNYTSPFNVGIGCDLSAGGAATYTVEYTFDDVFRAGFTEATATWFPLTGITAQTTDKDGAITAPCTAVRLLVSAWTSGTVTMTVIQAGGGV